MKSSISSSPSVRARSHSKGLSLELKLNYQFIVRAGVKVINGVERLAANGFETAEVLKDYLFVAQLNFDKIRSEAISKNKNVLRSPELLKVE